MQCSFIKVIRMKRGSSNCKMIVVSKIKFVISTNTTIELVPWQ